MEGDAPGFVTLTFREQQDGKRVAFLNGKCIIVGREWLDEVQHGERWAVRVVREFATYAIAEPMRRVEETAGASELGTVVSAASRAALDEATRARSASVEVRPQGRAPGPTTIQGMMMEPTDVIRTTDRVTLFIDSANIEVASRDLGFFLDWSKTLDFFLARGIFADAYYYVAEYGDDGPQRSFLDELSKRFIIRSKPVKIITDREGNRIIKGNLDIEVALDMVAASDQYDVAYLFSGDSDFKRVVELLQSRGKRVYVVTSRPTASRELRDIANKPVFFIEDFREFVERA